ncbi:MAG TPA: hypothetical protein VIE36_24785 [Methylomirabilota bacterium]|jgi:hypothetical protein
MTNPWKLATIGLAISGVTALGTGVTTAWMLRPTAPAEADTPTVAAPAAPAPRPAPRYAAVPAVPAAAPAVARPATAAPPRVTQVSSTAVAADCSTGGDRALRIAKPGALGALLGAGLGAAGGAIADGGKAAGKGALIGGIAGAALGTGYGAYKTKNECGTIFGDGAGAGAAMPGTLPAMQASTERIDVYAAR